MSHSVVNGLMFNLSWLAIVATHSDRLAPIIVTVHLFVHFVLWRGGWREALLVLGVSAFGLLFDRLLFASGIMLQDSGATAAPLWFSCLWPVFATTLFHLFSFLMRRPALAIPLGAMGGSASYLAGSRLADVHFASVPEGPVLLAIAWAFMLPLLVMCARHLRRLSRDQ